MTLWVAGLERRYNDGLASVSERIVARLERPRLTTAIRRRGDLLDVQHVPQFDHLAPQEIVTRRVHSNTALFVALVAATTGAGAMTRLGWLAGGSLLLAASHAAHIVAYVEHHYALHNIGPYYSPVKIAEARALGLREHWHRPAALRRDLVLAVANLFNVVGQRAIPIALWMPLFLRTLRAERTRAGSVAPRVGVVGPALGAGLVLASVAAFVAWSSREAPPPESIEGLHLGMGGIAAKLLLEGRGYDVSSGRGAGAHVGEADAWPRRGPLASRRHEPRYNWIGIRLAQPPDRTRWSVDSTCLVGIETAPSDVRPGRYRLRTESPMEACAAHWRSVGALG